MISFQKQFEAQRRQILLNIPQNIKIKEMSKMWNRFVCQNYSFFFSPIKPLTTPRLGTPRLKQLPLYKVVETANRNMLL